MKRSLVLVALAACAREPPPPVAVSSDLVVPPIAKGCSAQLTTGPIQKSDFGCYLDHDIQKGGVLHYPCSGDGAADVVFAGGLRYEGTMTGGQLRLEARTELDWEGDGCRWATTGTISGTKQKLEWRYADRVIRGDDCSGACVATASFDVHD